MLCPLGPALPGGGGTRSTKGRLTRVRRRYSAHLTELVTPDLAQILPDCPRRSVQRLLLNGGYTRSAVHRCVPMGLPNSLGCSVGSTIYIKGPQRPCLVPVTEIRHLAVQRRKKKLENVTSEIFSEFPPRGPNIECALGAPPGASRHPSRAKLTSIVLSVATLSFDGFSTCRVVFTILVTHHGSLRHSIPGAQYRLVPSTRPRNVGGGNPKTPHFYSFECEDTKCPGSPVAPSIEYM